MINLESASVLGLRTMIMLSPTLLKYLTVWGNVILASKHRELIYFDTEPLYMEILCCSGCYHFMVSNNDSGIREFDMERFQLLKNFCFPWPVNVSISIFMFFVHHLYLFPSTQRLLGKIWPNEGRKRNDIRLGTGTRNATWLTRERPGTDNYVKIIYLKTKLN